MEFSNDPIDLDGVPQLDPAAFRPLDPAHRRLIVLGHLAFGLVVAVVGGVAAAGIGLGAGLVALGVLLVVAISASLALLEVRHTGWMVRRHDLSYRRGVIVRSVETLPFARIQHARIERGPLQRALGIATVKVNTAGPDVRISGLSIADAERLKTIVVERSDATADESTDP
ncbi:MAG: PH domain-containing protein [Actinomycetota bacterium]